MTALISADTGDGAAGCASGSHTCSGNSPAFAPNPNSARKKRRSGPRAFSSELLAHAGEGVVAAAPLQDAEAEEDCDCPHVRDQRGRGSRRGGLGNAVLGGDQENRRASAIDSHATMNSIGIVGDHHQRHRREERVILEAERPGGVPSLERK